MYIFFDGVSSNGFIGLFSSELKLVASHNFQIAGNESTRTIPVIDEFISKQNIAYSDIKNIICVVGPGSFTGIRTISLVVNTLAFIYPNIYLTGVNFFDLFHDFPVVKTSSKRDLFVKYSESDIIKIVKNEDFEREIQTHQIYGDVSVESFEKQFIVNSYIDYESLMKNITLDAKKTLAPLYYKKPNIS